MDAKEDRQSSRTLASFCSKTAPATQVSQRNDLTEGRDGREGRSPIFVYLSVLLFKKSPAAQVSQRNDLTEGRDGREGR